jgi:cytochrome c oxidase subunit 1
LQKFITFSAIALMSAQVIFLVNVLVSLKRGERSDGNPWRSPSLEWSQDGASTTYDPYDYSRFVSSTNASK